MIAAAGALAGCGTSAGGPAASGSFSDGGVRVVANLSTLDGSGTLSVTLTPLRKGFRLYSMDLPPAGIDGLGRPTRVGLVEGLVATGRAVASRPVTSLRLSGLTTVLPVYPDGPVTVTIPVRSTKGTRPALTVSYAACSVATCLPPVSAHPLGLT